MRFRRSAVAIVLSAGVLVPAVSTAAVAWAKPASKPAAAQHAKAKPTKAVKTKKPKKVKVKFAASGSITAVDLLAGTVTVAAKGGTKDVKGSSVTVVVPATARIVLDDAPAALADLAVGYRITVTGTKLGTVYTAVKVQSSSPEPSDDPTPEPSDDPTPEPSEDPSPEPSAEPTA